jgi:hypothetical protein
MTANDGFRYGKFWIYVLLVVIFFACLWIGWRDFDPWIAQDAFRESFRAAIRSVIQLLVQFVVPGTILLFLGRELLTAVRRRKTD